MKRRRHDARTAVGTRWQRGASTTGVLAFLAVVLAISLLVVAGRHPPLTASLVAANARQLERLAAATTVTAPAVPGTTAQLVYTYGEPGCQLTGLLTLRHAGEPAPGAGGEPRLRFVFTRSEAARAGAAGRPAVPTVLLARDAFASRLVRRREPGALGLAVEPAAGPPGLRLNNLRGAGAVALDQARSAPLAALAIPLHCRFQHRDLELFAAVSELLKARLCQSLDGRGTGCRDTALALYRGVPGGQLRIDLRALGEELGVASYLLEVDPYRAPPRHGRLSLLRQATTLRLPAELTFRAPQDRGSRRRLRYDPRDPVTPAPLEVDLRLPFIRQGASQH